MPDVKNKALTLRFCGLMKPGFVQFENAWKSLRTGISRPGKVLELSKPPKVLEKSWKFEPCGAVAS